ncbi:MAG: hypothetical protein OEW21_06990 [Betaproteobacteria bacterium]|nr:hypothetical protein [Betaproteobacteria bacterium]
MKLKTQTKTLAVALGAAFALQGLSTNALAESTGNITNTTPGTTAATAHVDFVVVIPKFLSLRVGTGSLAAASATIDSITFTEVATDVGSNNVITGSALTVAAAGNSSGAAKITYTTTDAAGAALAALSDGTNTIPWSTIKVANGGVIAHPAALANAAGTTVATFAAGVFNSSDTWTYTFQDGGTVYAASAGTGYLGRVAYSLTQP